MARPTDWVDTVLNTSVASGSQGVQSIMTGLTPADLRGCTLIRTLISLQAHSTAVAGAWGIQQLHVGIGIGSQDAVALSAVPDPAISSEKPARGWIYRTTKGVTQNGVGTRIMTEWTADVRGARKVENGEIYIVFDNTVVRGTAFTVGLAGLIRLLIKLS